MSIQRFITGIQNFSQKIALINYFPSYFPKHLPTSLVLSQVNNNGLCLHYCSHLNFSKVIPHWGISINKIKWGFKEKNYTVCWNIAFFFIKCTLWGSSVMEGVSRPLLQPLLEGCSANGPARQELLSRQNCWPEASLGEVPCASRTRVWGWPCPQLKAMLLLSLFAEEASPGSSGRGRSEPAWPTVIFLARCLATSGAICHLQGHHQPFPSQQSWQISEDQWEKRTSILNPCQQFLPLLSGAGLARSSQ